MFPGFRLALPPKRWFKDNYDSDFLEDRQLGLQAFLQNLVAHKDIANRYVTWLSVSPANNKNRAPRLYYCTYCFSKFVLVCKHVSALQKQIHLCIKLYYCLQVLFVVSRSTLACRKTLNSLSLTAWPWENFYVWMTLLGPLIVWRRAG